VSTLADPKVLQSLLARSGNLRPDSQRKWGKMDVNQMMCHLADVFEFAVGRRAVPSRANFLTRSVMRWLALHTPVPWPKGVPTGKDVDPMRDGTKPSQFARDRERMVGLIREFASLKREARFGEHPAFGELSWEEWMIWAYRHSDHHFRQFGV